MPKEIDDFSVCGETWYGITEVQEILAHLEKARLWIEADGIHDPDIETIIVPARHNAFELKRHLIDLQIKFLTVL